MERSRKILFTASLGLIILIVWASFSEIDQTARATGTVIASSKSQNIQTIDGGILEQLLVQEGSKVNKGDLIAVLDRTRAQAAYGESEAKSMALKAQIARLRAESLGVPLVFPPELKNFPEIVASEKLLFQKRQKSITEELNAINEALKLAKEELKMNEPYLKTGDVAKSDILRLKRQVVDISTQYSTKKNKYFQDSQAELTKAQEELGAISQNVAQRKHALDHSELYAPMSGTVKNIKYTTIGAVLKPADELLQIVPSEDDLIIEVKIKSQDIAHIKPGIPAMVKIDAYDYTIYGTLEGTLFYISADTIDENLKQNELPYYKAKVKTKKHSLNSKKGEEIIIQPGMTATVEILTGQNTVLKYLIKPVIKTFSESLNEK